VDFAGGGVEVDGPLSFVDFGVVPPAEQDELVDVGGSAEVSGDEVVGVRPGNWSLSNMCDEDVFAGLSAEPAR
jgi:hypothetical protein